MPGPDEGKGRAQVGRGRLQQLVHGRGKMTPLSARSTAQLPVSRERFGRTSARSWRTWLGSTCADGKNILAVVDVVSTTPLQNCRASC